MYSSGEVNLALRKLVKDHGIPLSKLAEKLDISSRECLEWWAEVNPRLPLRKVRNLVSALGYSVEGLVNGEVTGYSVDVGLLDIGNRVNPRYTENAFSYTLSSKHIVEYLTLRFGTAATQAILAKLGVPRSYFEDTKNRISIHFFEDLLKEYVLLDKTDRNLGMLSKALFLTTEEVGEYMRLFPRCYSYADAFFVVAHSLKAFEENFDYDFDIYKDRVRITAKPSEKLVEATKTRQFGSKILYSYRHGLANHMVAACGLPSVQSRVKKCVSQGDEVSVYEAEYPSCKFLNLYS